MRNAVRISFLATVLLLFAVPVVNASDAKVFKNEYGVFGYDFTPERDGKVHWYEEKISVLPINCCRYGSEEVHNYYFNQGRGEWREFVESLIYLGDVSLLRDALAYVNVYSVKEMDLLLAEAMLHNAEHLDITAYMYRDDADAQGVVRFWRVEAEKNRKLADELQSQYLGTPGGL